MLRWSEIKLKKIEQENLCGFIFKSRSPSSGIKGVTVYTSSGMPGRKGAGIFGRAFLRYFPLLPVIDDGRLHDPVLRENFIENVFVYKRWKELVNKGGSIKGLMDFHTEHKLLIMAHSPRHLSTLGKFVANTKNTERDESLSQYIKLLMEGLQLPATVKKNTNVLLHIVGYFKKVLPPDDKKELLEIIDNYHKGFMPLIVPIFLINHYIRRFDEHYLKKQFYLNPHPMELMLRNHT
jgi:uncharacterized protein YbgA (DUF1722 family)